MSKYRILPVGGGGIVPSGTLEIRSEGTFDVTDYAKVDVDIFDDTTTKTITNNGVYNASDDNVLGYSQVTVQVPASAVDSGTLTIEPITQNVTLFTQDVVGYAALAFQVAVPASEVDHGTKPITANGTGIDVVGYASVDVAVPQGVFPTGTKSITANGTGIDVTNYASVDVDVPASAVDSGTKQTSIATNSTQTINVVGYASHEISVSVPAPYWTGTQAQYDALQSYDNNTVYLITN